MATEGDRNQYNGTSSPKQNWRSRIDPRHSQSNVPVLFRLKNLQRVSADGSVEPNSPAMSSDYAGQSQVREVERSRKAAPAVATRSQAAPVSGTPSAAAAKPDPVTAPGKHGVSNGFILLIAAVAVIFAIGRNFTQSSPAVQTANSQVASTTVAANAPSAATSTATTPVAAVALPSPPTNAKADEPLMIPELPKLAIDDAATKLDSSSESPKDTDKTTEAKRDDSGLVLLNPDESLKNESSDDSTDKLPLPSTLTTVENPNVPKTTDSPKEEADKKPLEASTADKPIGPSMATTATPDRDIEAMMQARSTFLAQNPANVQSQFDALVRARSTIPTTATPNFTPPQTNLAAQPSYGPQPNIAQTPSYAAPQPNYAVAPPTAGANISAQPVGYGQSVAPNANFSSSMPNAAAQNGAIPNGAMTAPMTSYPLPGTPTSPQSFAPNPSSSTNGPAYTQPTNQPYRPVFADPASMPMPNGVSAPAAGNFAVPPASPTPTAPVPYVPIGNTFNPNGY